MKTRVDRNERTGAVTNEGGRAIKTNQEDIMSTGALYRGTGFLLPLFVLGLGACGGAGSGDLASDSAAVRQAAERLADAEQEMVEAEEEMAEAEEQLAASEEQARASEDAAEPASGGTTGGAAADPEPEAEAVAEPEPEPELATVPSGTLFTVALGRQLSTESVAVGDTFTATLESGLDAGGETVVPAGAVLHGEVTAVQKSGGAGQTAVLKLNFSRVAFAGSSYPVAVTIVEANPETSERTTTGEAATRIGVGAAAGAVLGRIIGGDTEGAIIGGAVGAAAGSAIVLGTRDVDAVLPAGSPMELRLDEPLVVRVGS